MIHDWTFWFFLVCILLAGGLIMFVRAYGSRHGRQEALRFADQYGFRELNADAVIDANQKQEIELLRRGYGGKFGNAWEGMYKGQVFRIFTYSYNFGLPLVAHIGYSQTVIALLTQNDKLPAFAMGPKSELDRGLSTMKWRAVEFSAKEFSGQNLIITPQPNEMKAILEGGFGSFLENLPRDYRMSIESGGGWLVAFRKKTLIGSTTWPSVMEDLLLFTTALRNSSIQSAKARH